MNISSFYHLRPRKWNSGNRCSELRPFNPPMITKWNWISVGRPIQMMFFVRGVYLNEKHFYWCDYESHKMISQATHIRCNSHGWLHLHQNTPVTHVREDSYKLCVRLIEKFWSNDHFNIPTMFFVHVLSFKFFVLDGMWNTQSTFLIIGKRKRFIH